MRRHVRALSVLAVLALAAATLAARQQPGSGAEEHYVRTHYTKYEFRIAMRDGARLFTAVYVPKTCDAGWPIVLTRTPYSVSPYGADNYPLRVGPSVEMMKEGFIFVHQDVRGRYMSEGTWVEVRPHLERKSSPRDVDESTDAWDTIDWLVKHVPCNNGRVGTWGISYPGFYVSAGMIDAHPALKAASPQAPVTDYYLGDDSFHNGAFMLAANFGFYGSFTPRDGEPSPPRPGPRFDYGTPDGYAFHLEAGSLWDGARRYGLDRNPYYTLNLEHTSYDAFWKARSIWRHFRNLPPAVMPVGGWFDAEDLMGPLRTYRQVGEAGSETRQLLVMGPWTHGGFARGDGDRVGNVDYGQKTAAYYREKIELPFFVAHLKDKGVPPEGARVFETGTNRWRSFETWPPSQAAARTFYLRERGQLLETAPSAADGVDEYVSDPNRPVPYVGHVQIGMQRDYMTEDQRFAAQRPDVLVYQTEPLAEDLTVAGPIGVTLHVSTSGTDSDFVVKVIDVYPPTYPQPEWPGTQPPPANHVRMGGYQQLVRGEPFRGKFRRGFEAPVPFVPGQPDVIRFDLPDVAHTFRSGHRLMVQIQSSWFPLIDRNPQTFLDIPSARPQDFQKATERVYRSTARPSAITLSVLPPG